MRTPAILTVFCLTLTLGCTDSPRSQEQVRRGTAAATSTIVSDVKGAAEGIKDGLHQEIRKDHAFVNINTATRPNLEILPGITPPLARKIIAHRPYTDPNELRTRHILTDDQYSAISGRISTSGS